MNEFILYSAPQSTCSQRVRFALNAKGLGFDEHKLDLFSGDQLKPEYLNEKYPHLAALRSRPAARRQPKEQC